MSKLQKTALVALLFGLAIHLVAHFSPAALVEWARSPETPAVFSILDNGGHFIAGMSISPFIPLALYIAAIMFIAGAGRTLANQKGLTLVEIMIVLVILSVMATFAYANIDRGLFVHRDAARDFYSQMQFAKMEAVRRNATVTVGINATGWAIYDGATLLKQSSGLDSRVTFTGNSPSTVINGTAYAHSTQFTSRGLQPVGSANATYSVVFDAKKKIEVTVSVAGGVKSLQRTNV